MKKEDKRRNLALGGIGIVVIAAAGYFYMSGGKEEEIKPPPNTIYYTGPMKSKSGKNEYSGPNGELLTEEQAKAGRDQWLKDHPEVAEMNKKAS